MFVTNDASLYEHVLTLSNHGRARGQTKQFWADIVGFKYKMSNVQAAIGCAQLERVEELVARKREIMQAYRDAFAEIPTMSMNPEPPGTVNGCWMPTVVFAPETGVTRERLLEAFKAENIDARVFFWPLSGLPMLKPTTNTNVCHDISHRALNLPSYHDISPSDLRRVSDRVIDAMAAQSDHTDR
jgi:perosamine synthetase